MGFLGVLGRIRDLRYGSGFLKSLNTAVLSK